MGHYTEANEVRTRVLSFRIYEGRKIVADCDTYEDAQRTLARYTAQRPPADRFICGTARTEPLYGCDCCDGYFTEDNMATLGGDRYIDGYAPQAYPAVCEDCQAEAEAMYRPRRLAVAR
jgi:hypothetical protein